MKAHRVQHGDRIDHTPSTDVLAGTIVRQQHLVGVADLDIPANRLGALSIRGLYQVSKKNEAIDAGQLVYWDANGQPVWGEPNSGAATATAADGFLLGIAVGAAEAGARLVVVTLMQAERP